MGESPTWGFPPRRRAMGREQVVLAHHPEPRLRETRMPRQTRSRAGPCGVPRPPRGMPPGRPRWPPAEPRPRSRASVPGALLVGAQRWPAAGISWRRTRNGQNPRPHRPAGGRRPNPCRERWRHSSPRPPPPQRAGSPSWPPAVPPASTPRSASWRCPVPPSPDRPCSLSEADPGDRVTPLLEPAWNKRTSILGRAKLAPIRFYTHTSH